MMRLWGEAPRIIADLDAARASGVDVSADVYPYSYWQTTMRILFPDKDFANGAGPAMNFRDTVPPDRLILQRFAPDPELAGRTIATIAAERGLDPVALYLELMRQALDYEAAHPEAAGSVESVIGEGMDERDIAAFIAWPHTSICSDGADGGHPRGYGAFTRVLSVYVRERGVLTLEDAVRKMSSLNAATLGLLDRGVIAPGAYADIVIFRRVEGQPDQRYCGAEDGDTPHQDHEKHGEPIHGSPELWTSVDCAKYQHNSSGQAHGKHRKYDHRSPHQLELRDR